jgi:endoglucanase
VREFSDRGGIDDNRKIVIETEEPIADPILGMWDLPSYEVRDGHLRGRVCDDLAGVAAIMATLEELATLDRTELPTVTAVFTRAEEAGFCGALCLVDSEESAALLPPTSLIVSVEISGATPGAKLGGGAIVRVGDKASFFDQDLLEMMWRATAAARETGHLNVRRALMDLGTCEATAFAAKGYRAAGVCVPVGNYHNMDFDLGEIGPEHVSVHDLEMLQRLLVTVARECGRAEGADEALQSAMRDLTDRGRRNLRPALPTAAAQREGG